MGYTTNNGNIETNLRADIMRSSMENKNILTTAFSMYIGTGEKDSNNVAITKELKIYNDNLVFVSGSELKTGTLLNENFLQTLYTSLKTTWESYKILDCNFGETTYPNLKLKNNNFSTSIYSGISFQDSPSGASVLIPGAGLNAGQLYLQEKSGLQTLIYYPLGLNSLYCTKVKIVRGGAAIYFSFYSTEASLTTINNLKTLYSKLLGVGGARFCATGVAPISGTYYACVAAQTMFQVSQVTSTEYRLECYYGGTVTYYKDSDLTISSTNYQIL